jgi:hypothetical protein
VTARSRSRFGGPALLLRSGEIRLPTGLGHHIPATYHAGMPSVDGRRYPTAGRAGLYVSFWANLEDLHDLDALGNYWGMTRSQTIKRAVSEAHHQAQRFPTARNAPPVRLKGQHRQPRRNELEPE